MPTRRLTVAGVTVLISLTLAACGGDHGSHGGALKPIGTAAPGAVFADADVRFAQGMIPHHEQAVEMSDMALASGAGASADVTGLAAAMKAAQDPEITQMMTWLGEWGYDTGNASDHAGMPGMMSGDQMKDLGAATGADFDKRWLEMMIEHHEGAIAMANDAIKDAKNPDVVAFAKTIVAAQQAELDTMKSLLA
jgi:uncharacterized protein (DUF305 family)